MREDRNKSSCSQRVAAQLNRLTLIEEMDRATKNIDISAHGLVFQLRSSSDLSRGLADSDHKQNIQYHLLFLLKSKWEAKCNKKESECCQLGIINVSKYCSTQQPQRPLSIHTCEFVTQRGESHCSQRENNKLECSDQTLLPQRCHVPQAVSWRRWSPSRNRTRSN